MKWAANLLVFVDNILQNTQNARQPIQRKSLSVEVDCLFFKQHKLPFFTIRYNAVHGRNRRSQIVVVQSSSVHFRATLPITIFNNAIFSLYQADNRISQFHNITAPSNDAIAVAIQTLLAVDIQAVAGKQGQLLLVMPKNFLQNGAYQVFRPRFFCIFRHPQTFLNV